jgi:hypothetical protein
VAEQVAVVDGAQPEVLEATIAVDVDGEVELAGVVLDEPRRLVADQPLGVTQRDRLAERHHALVPDLLDDVAREQPRGQPRVLRLLADHLGGRLDRQPVQLGGGGAVVQAADGAGRHPHRVDVGQVAADAVDRPHDLVDVDRLVLAVALAHLHPSRRLQSNLLRNRRGAHGCFCDRHFSLLARQVRGRSETARGRRSYDEE